MAEAAIKVLTDNDGNRIYPLTTDNAVVCESGATLRNTINTLQENVGKKYEKPATGIPPDDIALNKLFTSTTFLRVITGKDVYAYSSTTEYNKDEYVVYDGKIFASLEDTNVGNTPKGDSTDTHWKKVDIPTLCVSYCATKIITSGDELNEAVKSVASGEDVVKSIFGSQYCNYNIADAWKPSTSYVTGNVISHESKTYVCKEDHTSSEEWDETEASKWDTKPIASCMSGKSFDFSTLKGMYEAVKGLLSSFGGGVTNFPTFN